MGRSREPSAKVFHALAGEVEHVLRREILDRWFPTALDEAGGFHQDFDRTWTRTGDGTTRHLVHQARLTWTAAVAARAFPAQAQGYRAACTHGLSFLADRLWDRKRGGFYWAVDVSGSPVGRWAQEKHAYGQAFGVYAAATAWAAAGEAQGLELARRAFQWLEVHARDHVHGGYFEALDLDGRPIAKRPGLDAIGSPYGCKSLNGHLHLLEALIALHGVWPEPTVAEALAETFGIIGERARVGERRLGSLFSADWRVLAAPQAWGHEVEAAWMLLEAGDTLGELGSTRTDAFPRALVDRTLRGGFDHRRGGVYAGARLRGLARDRTKVWWAQAELLKALLLMHGRHGERTDRYWRAFLKTWDFVRDRQIDPVHGGWLRAVTASGKPLETQKSDPWTDPYHQARALIDVRAWLLARA